MTEGALIALLVGSVFVDERGMVASTVYDVMVPEQMRQHVDAMLQGGVSDTAARIMLGLVHIWRSRRSRTML